MRPALPIIALTVLLSLAVAARAADQIGPGGTGLPGLAFTRLPPESLASPVRVGCTLELGRIDPLFGLAGPDSLGRTVDTGSLRLHVSLHASRGTLLAASLPLRWYSVERGERVTGLGDAQLSVAARWFRLRSLAIGAWGSVRFPTGEDVRGLGTGRTEGEFGLTSTLTLSEGRNIPDARMHWNVGYQINKNETRGHGVIAPDAGDVESTGVFPPFYPAQAEGEDTNVNDALLLRLGVEFRRRWAHLFLEYAVDWLVHADAVSFRENVSWFTPGLYLGKEEGLAAKLAWSIALTSDDPDTELRPALPDWYLQAGVSYPFFLGGRDSDGDTIVDSDDACPDAMEDRDGYEDEDGCPDPDNDADGILDRYDIAPNLPEDFDGFEDEDGRPDLDNDLDGVPDSEDACPNLPEDFDSFEDTDGCPDVILDADGDGIEDAVDRCPQAAEDMDGFEDEDGCPDPDNDLDGIADADDACPDAREDYDGDEDEDGCPDAP